MASTSARPTGFPRHVICGPTITVTYSVSVALSNRNRTITLTVGACGSCGNLAAGAAGTYKFVPATNITDFAGQTAPEFDTASTFKIF
jgi:hypothetical protein